MFYRTRDISSPCSPVIKVLSVLLRPVGDGREEWADGEEEASHDDQEDVAVGRHHHAADGEAATVQPLHIEEGDGGGGGTRAGTGGLDPGTQKNFRRKDNYL